MGDAEVTSRYHGRLPLDLLDQRRIVIRGAIHPSGHRIRHQPIWVQSPGDFADRVPIRQFRIEPLPPALWVENHRLAVVDEREG